MLRPGRVNASCQFVAAPEKKREKREGKTETEREKEREGETHPANLRDGRISRSRRYVVSFYFDDALDLRFIVR